MLVLGQAEPVGLVTRVTGNDGVVVERQTRLVRPQGAGEEKAPLVLVFHGSGGSGPSAMRSMGIHVEMPEAFVASPTGLMRFSQVAGRDARGWVSWPLDESNRDFAFVSALLDQLMQEYPIDEKRIYAMGHSNGGGFTYALWAGMGERFAGFAPSAAAPGARLQGGSKPIFMQGRRGDEVVPFAQQKETMQAVLSRLGAGTLPDRTGTVRRTGSGDVPVWVRISEGSHQFDGESLPEIAAFFRSLR